MTLAERLQQLEAQSEQAVNYARYLDAEKEKTVAQLNAMAGGIQVVKDLIAEELAEDEPIGEETDVEEQVPTD